MGIYGYIDAHQLVFHPDKVSGIVEQFNTNAAVASWLKAEGSSASRPGVSASWATVHGWADLYRDEPASTVMEIFERLGATDVSHPALGTPMDFEWENEKWWLSHDIGFPFLVSHAEKGSYLTAKIEDDWVGWWHSAAGLEELWPKVEWPWQRTEKTLLRETIQAAVEVIDTAKDICVCDTVRAVLTSYPMNKRG